MPAVAVAAAGVVGGIYSANKQARAARDAAGAQQAASEAGIAEQRRQFDAVQKLMQPYVQAGSGALAGQQSLLGLNGNDSQAAAIEALRNSPQFTSLLAQGENSILQNASATGGLRGGNTQAALAQFSPALLAQTINDQYARLGGITALGQNAAAGVGNAGMQTGNNVTSLLGQIGAAQAGNALAQGKAQAGYANAITGGIGALFGGGFGGSSAPAIGQSGVVAGGSGLKF